MTKKPTIDGFIPRRPSGVIGEYHVGGEPRGQRPSSGFEPSRVPRERSYEAPIEPPRRRTSLPLPPSAPKAPAQGLSRRDVDESLQRIDTDGGGSNPKGGRRKRGGEPGKRKKITKRIIIGLVVLLVLAGGYLVVKALLAGQSAFKGDVFGLVQQKDLKMDENGRSNILILGTSEDDPGHEAGYLTDSIMILSVDQKAKNAYMISIPRDLEAKYGMACLSGYAGKVNAYFNCVNDESTDAAEQERQAASREFFGGIVGLDIQYSVHVNYSVMRDIVAALGGITVTIESRDPRGQMDSNFDWKCKGGNAYASLATMKKNCPPSGHFIDYPNGPVHLDAEHALYLAQARGDTAPTYGFERSNFDREQNQQKIVKAIKDKALSTGTLTNLGKVTGIIDALGKNLRTNFEISEVRTLVSLAQNIPNTSITGLDLQADGIMTGNAQPAEGLYQFSALQAYIHKKFNTSPVAREDAHVVVLNASGVAGVAKTEGDALEKLGMTIDAIDNAPEGGQYTGNVVYQLRTTKPETAKKLASLYGATVSTGTPPVEVAETTDFVIVVLKPTVTTDDQ